MLRPRLRIPPLGAALQQRRSMHNVPLLAHNFRELGGVPGLLGEEGFNIAWTQYMAHLMEKLNLLTAGTEWESQEAKKIILGTARNPLDARTFNYASAAHNNHWFFKRLTPTPKPMSSAFAAQLAASFSSVETLKREFVVTAEVMFGPGYIWLVKLTNNRDAPGQMHPYRLLTTYLAGTPYAGGHWRRQEVDRNTVSREHEAAGTLAGANWPRTRGAKGTVESQVPAPGGINVQPLLCLNTWEHVWLRDYGFGVGGHGGKANYVENWWDVVDWEAVEYDAFATSGKQKFKQ